MNMKKLLKKIATVILAMSLSITPVDLAFATENDSTATDDAGTGDAGVTDPSSPGNPSTGDGTDEGDPGSGGDPSDPEEVHYWDHYSWDDNYHMLVCKCGVNNCPLAGTDSRSEHQLGEWSIARQPTTTEEGLKNRACWCGYTQEETIPKIVEDKPEVKPNPGEEPGGPGSGDKPDSGENNGDQSGDDTDPGKNPGGETEEPKPGEDPEKPKPEDPKPGEKPDKPEEPKPGEKPEEKPEQPAKPGESGGNGSGSNNNGGSSTPSSPAPVTPPASSGSPSAPSVPSVPMVPEKPVKPTTPTVTTPPAFMITTILPMRMWQVTIEKSKVLKAGKKVKLQVTYDGVKITRLNWKTSNRKYATVNKNGVVTVKKAGRGKTVKITATGLTCVGQRLVRVKVIFKMRIK